MEPDIKTIVDLCCLSGLTSDSNGWRAETPFKGSHDDKKSLSIGFGGGWTCHYSGKTGHVVQLYAHMRGTSVHMARASLIKEGILPRGFEQAPITVKLNPEAEEEDDKSKEAVKSAGVHVKGDADWERISRWRSISTETILECVESGSMSWASSYPGVGEAIVFFQNSPPLDISPSERKSIMARSTIPEVKDWKSAGSYPIWSPKWVSGASKIVLFEGQWDALAFQDAINTHGLSGDVQVMAMVGGKSFKKTPELTEYFKDKIVVQIPDNDEKGTEIFISCREFFEGCDVEHRIMRMPVEHGKDFNDWWKKRPSKDDLMLWLESSEKCRVSNGIIIDSEYIESHKIGPGVLFEVGPDGEPIPVLEDRVKSGDPVTSDDIIDLVRGYPILEKYIKECGKVCESPYLYHAMAFLTYFSAVLGRRLKFESGSSGMLYPNIFTLFVGGSGLGKSESMEILKRIVSKVNPEMFCGDGFSAEALLEDLQDHPQRMLIFTEFAEWMRAKETSYKYNAVKVFIRMYDSHHFSTTNPFVYSFRTKGKSIKIEEPYLSLLAACTEEQALVKDEDTLKGGMIGRFFFAFSKEKGNTIYIPSKIPDSFCLEIEKFFKDVIMTPVRSASSMRLSDDAMKVYKMAYDRFKEWCVRSDFSGDLDTYTSRWRVQIFKLAMMFELLRSCHQWPLQNSNIMISEQSILSAIKLNRFLLRCFCSLFIGQFKSDSNSKAAKMRARVVKCLMEHSAPNAGGVKRSDLFRYIQESKNTIDDCLFAMLEAGEIIEKQSPKGKRGRRSVSYLLVKRKLQEEIHEFKKPKHIRSNHEDGGQDGRGNHSEHDRGNEEHEHGSGVAGGIQMLELPSPVEDEGSESPIFDPNANSEMGVGV